MKSKPLTRDQVAEVISYAPEIGDFYHSESGVLITIDRSTGYSRISIRGRYYYCHRLAWLMVHGEWPAKMVDHINRNKFDNRICNLRQANAVENQYNRPAQKNNSSGAKGVVWRKDRGVWQVTFRANKKRLYFGSFKTFEAAELSAEKFRSLHHGEFAMS